MSVCLYLFRYDHLFCFYLYDLIESDIQCLSLMIKGVRNGTLYVFPTCMVPHKNMKEVWNWTHSFSFFSGWLFPSVTTMMFFRFFYGYVAGYIHMIRVDIIFFFIFFFIPETNESINFENSSTSSWLDIQFTTSVKFGLSWE